MVGTTSNKNPGSDEKQTLMFTDPKEGEMNIGLSLRAALFEAIKKSGKKRSQICMEIFELTQTEVSQHTLNNWTAESKSKSYEREDFNGNKRWGIPAEMVPALCHITGDLTPLIIQCESLNTTLLEGEELLQAELGKLKKIKKQINAMEKTVTRILKRLR